MTCRHCGKHAVTRPRGLCWGCYYRPGVREQYPSNNRFVLLFGDESSGLPEPTRALPGSAAKIAVLAERARLRQELFHPDDAWAYVEQDQLVEQAG